MFRNIHKKEEKPPICFQPILLPARNALHLVPENLKLPSKVRQTHRAMFTKILRHAFISGTETWQSAGQVAGSTCKT